MEEIRCCLVVGVGRGVTEVGVLMQLLGESTTVYCLKGVVGGCNYR
jgi:hypothetical protein